VTPCCGTGVVFRRDILASIGGQSYGSISEDTNTSMNLLAAGFASLYLNERLVFGMVPETVAGELKLPLVMRAACSLGICRSVSCSCT
jgi:cellulose synthase/poly-beta-1,6-N-acetylglucosamine synthase-like glycosyltransferase